MCAPGPDPDGRGAGPGAEAGGPAATGAERFAAGLFGLAELARDHRGLPAALRSETAVGSSSTPATRRARCPARTPRSPADLLAVADRLERALRPLSLDWYADAGGGLGRHSTCATPPPAAPRRSPDCWRQRSTACPCWSPSTASGCASTTSPRPDAPRRRPRPRPARLVPGPAGAPGVRPGAARHRRATPTCGAGRSAAAPTAARLRTVYPGMDAAAASPPSSAGRSPASPPDGRHGPSCGPGRVEPAKDLVALLHAFALVREDVPGHPAARSRTPDRRARPPARGVRRVRGALPGAGRAALPGRGGRRRTRRRRTRWPSSEVGGPDAADARPTPTPRAAWWCSPASSRASPSAWSRRCSAAGPRSPPTSARCARSSAAPGWSCRRATRARSPTPASPCCATRTAAARLGAAARARALELFTVEQNTAAFRGIYLDLVAHCPVERRRAGRRRARPVPRTAESSVPGAGRRRPLPGPCGPARGGVPGRRARAPAPLSRTLRAAPGRAGGRPAAPGAPRAAVAAAETGRPAHRSGVPVDRSRRRAAAGADGEDGACARRGRGARPAGRDRRPGGGRCGPAHRRHRPTPCAP